MTLGAPFSGTISALPSKGLGPPNGGAIDAIPGSGIGTLFSGPAEAIPTTALGAIFDHIVVASPLTTTGPQSDEFVLSGTAGHGPVFDHDAITIDGAIGPISDEFVGTPNDSRSGPVFDHIAIGTFPPDWVHGAVYDSWPVAANLSKFGPVMDGLVSKIPDPVDLTDPDPVVADVERNVLEPQLVEFLSPGAYALEKDLEGKIRGFKF